MTLPAQTSDAHAVFFGKYLLDRELARGGMSRVFRARLRGPGGFEKKLVVKQILPELAREPSFVELFVREANTLVQMSHPSLVPVYELGVVDGVYFLAMEWVQGATIAELLRDGPLPAPLVTHIGAQIAEALGYAHERFGLVHRDVTPRNVIVDTGGHPRLLDFGIAAKTAHTGRGEVFGSRGYMSPEQERGEPLTPASDLFSLGAVLLEAATGCARWPREPRPGDGGAFAELRVVEPQLGALFERMVAMEPAARPQSAAEVASALRTWLAERHPRGVERELASRAQAAHDRREQQPHPQPATAADASKSGPTHTRSIATSPVLTDLLAQATERLDRDPVVPVAAPPSSPRLSADPEAQRVWRRILRDFWVISVAVAIGIYWATHSPSSAERDTARHTTPAPASSRAPSPPVTASSAPAPAPARAPAVTSSPAAARLAAPPVTSAHGFLTVSATPWAEVRIDGRGVGVTPQRKLVLRAGTHSLQLKCPPLGTGARASFAVRAGDTTQIVADLREPPGTLSIK